jgi:hypothetical protein
MCTYVPMLLFGGGSKRACYWGMTVYDYLITKLVIR